MKSYEFYSPISLLLVEILIRKGYFGKKPHNLGHLHLSIIIYNQFSQTDYIQIMMLFVSWTIMFINEVLWFLFAYYSFISGDINFERFPFPKPHNFGQMYTSTYL